MPEPSEEFMTVAEVAAILKLNQQTVRNMTTDSCQRSASDDACGSNDARSTAPHPPTPKPGRYRPPDRLLAFLESL